MPVFQRRSSALSKPFARESAFDALVPEALRGAASIREAAEIVFEAGQGAEGAVVFLAVDGVAIKAVENLWSCDEMVALRSSVPTTSATAWLSALTGAPLDDHLVPGLVFRPNARAEPINVAETRSNDPWAGDLIPEIPTVFERLRDVGVASLACLGGLTAYPGPWRDALLRGSTQIPSHRFPSLSPDPMLAATAAIADVEDALRQSPSVDCLVFAYLDLDSAVHARGYDHEVTSALQAIDAAARRWSLDGTTVLALSDHGLIPVSPSTEALACWERLEASPFCNGLAGGAGRIRWLYAKPGAGDELLTEASSVLSRWAEVVDASKLPLDPRLSSRIGSVVAVACDPEFPLARGHGSWDHGATSEDELIVPLAHWGNEGPWIVGRA